MKKAIVVVTEGASAPLLEDWTSRGLLPGFTRLMREGVSGPLRSGFVPYEVPGLLSAFSGYRPGDHGCYSYWAAHNADYRPRILGSADVRRQHLWRRPEMADKRFAVLNVFGTHPVQAINGWLVSYPMQRSMRMCSPDDLLFRLSSDGTPLTHDLGIWYAGQAREDFVGKVIDADRRRVDALLSLLREGPDVAIVNLTAIDRVSHFYWHELEPGSPWRTEETAIYRAFKVADEALLRLTETMDRSTSLLAFSEIGFGPLRAYVAVNKMLAAAGLLTERDGAVVWSDSVAFEAVQGTHGVNVNLKGRNVQGRVAPEDYERVRADVIEALLRAINPHTGLPLFQRVLPREEVYSGAAVGEAPDILLDPADARYLPLGDPLWATKVSRTLQSGWHRQDSFWAGIGPSFGGASRGRTAKPEDVAPTVFLMTGRDVPGDLVGSALS